MAPASRTCHQPHQSVQSAERPQRGRKDGMYEEPLKFRSVRRFPQRAAIQGKWATTMRFYAQLGTASSTGPTAAELAGPTRGRRC